MDKMNTNNILIIIPAYNEQDNILHTYNELIKYKQKNLLNFDILVINDGSNDKTQEILNTNNIPNLNLCRNLGIGNSVQTGYKYAHKHNYDIAVQFDGDGQHDVAYMPNIIEPIINKEANYVIGSRFIDKTTSKFKSSLARQTGIKILSWLLKVLTGIKLFDITSGFRAVDKNIIKIFSTNYPSEYPEPIAPIKVIKAKYKIIEVPVNMNERTGGKSSINKFKSIYYMLNVTLAMILETLGGWKHEY